MKFRKKPVVIEAVHMVAEVSIKDAPEWLIDAMAKDPQFRGSCLGDAA